MCYIYYVHLLKNYIYINVYEKCDLQQKSHIQQLHF